MFDKLTDKANILKAKITKDDLQEKLVSATSEQNWQAPTNVLHEIANAAYNYQKWQKINDFIWDKLKKKSTWRKIVKTLNLVEFLLKNGPPSAISSFKYDIYQFRAFSDYQAYHEGVDRGQSIREKAKQIVDLLSNQQLLEQQREKAKKIRQRMAGVTGGMSYGAGGNGYGYGGSGDGKYQSYNNKSYGEKPSNGGSYGNSDYTGGLGVYGDYNYGKSTLDKYKSDKQKGNTSTTTGKQTNIPNITGITGIQQSSITSTQKPAQQPKKPFGKIAPKLEKPGQKKQQPKISPTTTGTVPKQNYAPTENVIDIDITGFGNTTQTTNKPAPIVNPPQNNVNVVQPPVQNPQPQPVQGVGNFNQLFTQPQPQPQPQTQPQFNLNQGYGQPYGQPYTQPYGQQFNQPYGAPFQPYGNPYGQPTYPQQGYNQPVFNQPAYNQPTYTAQYQPTGFNLTTPVQPVATTQPKQTQQLTLSTKQQDDFGSFESAPTQSNLNVKWLNDTEKGLIDFSDFSTEIKNMPSQPSKPKQERGNNIQIDPWKW